MGYSKYQGENNLYNKWNSKNMFYISVASSACSMYTRCVNHHQSIDDNNADILKIESASYQYSNASKYDGKEIITDTWLVKDQGAMTYTTVTRDDLCIPVSGSVSALEIGKELHYHWKRFYLTISILGLSSSSTCTHFEAKIEDPSIITVAKECLGVNSSSYISFKWIHLIFPCYYLFKTITNTSFYI